MDRVMKEESTVVPDDKDTKSNLKIKASSDNSNDSKLKRWEESEPGCSSSLLAPPQRELSTNLNNYNSNKAAGNNNIKLNRKPDLRVHIPPLEILGSVGSKIDSNEVVRPCHNKGTKPAVSHTNSPPSPTIVKPNPSQLLVNPPSQKRPKPHHNLQPINIIQEIYSVQAGKESALSFDVTKEKLKQQQQDQTSYKTDLSNTFPRSLQHRPSCKAKSQESPGIDALEFLGQGFADQDLDETDHSTFNHLTTGKDKLTFRQKLTRRIHLPKVESLINFLVLVDWFILASVVYQETPDGDFVPTFLGHEIKWPYRVRYIINLIFLMELLLKLYAYGLVFSPDSCSQKNCTSSIKKNTFSASAPVQPTSQCSFNIVGFIDLISVSAFWMNAILSLPNLSHLDLSNWCLLVALSALRPIRLLCIIPQFSPIINSLSKSLPLLGNLAFFLAYFFLLFGTLGLVLFKGQGRSQCSFNNETVWPSRYCSGHYVLEDGAGNSTIQYIDKKNENYSDPFFIGYICPHPLICHQAEVKDTAYLNFDTIFSSTLTVYVISSVEKWTDIMYRVMATVSPWASIFFISCVMVLNYWLVTLFVAVIARIFEKIREDEDVAKYLADKASAPAPVVQDGFEFQLGQPGQNPTNVPDEPYMVKIKPTKPEWKFVLEKAEKAILKILPFLNFIGLVLIGVDLLTRSYHVRRFPSYPEVYFPINMLLFIESTLQLLRLRQPAICSTESNTPSDIGIRWARRGIWLHFYSCLLNLLVILFADLISPKARAVLSIFAIFRFYRLAFAVPRIQDLVFALAARFSGIISLLGFILACIALVAPLSTHLVCLSWDKSSNPNSFIAYFGSLPHSMVTLFQIFSGEDWPEVMVDTTSLSDSHSKVFIIIFFVVWSGFSNFILLNLFIALTMESFELAESRKHRSQIEAYVETATKTCALKSKNPISPWNLYRYLNPAPSLIKLAHFPKSLLARIPTHLVTSLLEDSNKKAKEVPDAAPRWSHPVINYLTHNLGALASKNPLDEVLTERDYTNAEFCQLHPSYDSTWFLFSPKNSLRKLCQQLTDVDPNHRRYSLIFNFLVWLAVIAAVMVALINTPQYRLELITNYESRLYLREIDLVLAFFFLVEFGVRTIAHGFLLTPNAYLKHPWYAVDFVVLLVFLLDVCVSPQPASHFNQVVRALKAFRALRLMSLVPKVKDTIYGVFIVGFPRILDVSLLLLGFIVPYALYGHLLFSAQGASCSDPLMKSLPQCVGEFVNPDNGIYMPRAWENYDTFSFATIGGSLLVLVEILSGEKWVGVMDRALQFSGEGFDAFGDTNWWYGLYFVMFYIIGTVIVLSMFVAVIIENYRRYTGAARLTSNQRRWIDLRKQLRQTVPSLRPTYAFTPFQQWCRRRSIEKVGLWPNLLSSAHVLLMLCLVTEFYNQDPDISEIKNYVLVPLLVISVADPVMRLIGLGGAAFLRRPWASAHAVLTGLALVVTLISIFSAQKLFMYDLSNILCLIASLKLMLRFNRLSELAQMASASLPDILMTLYAWLVLFITYAILFMQIFGLTRLGPLGSDEANFRNVGITMLMLFRMTTGEGWNDVMHDYAVQEPFCINTPGDYLASDCGNPALAYILFLSFNVLSMFIFTNLFVVIVMDNFNYCHDIAASFSLLTRQDIRHFKRTWSMFDRHARGYIKSESLIPFIMALQPPFGMRYFDPHFSIRSLLTSYKTLGPSDLNNHQAYANWLGEKLAQIPHHRSARRRRRFNIFYLHAMSMEEPGKGLSFTNILLLLSQYKLIDPDQCLSIQDLLQFKQTRKNIYNTYYKEKALGMCRTWILRRNFLKTLRSKHASNIPALPMIFVDESSHIDVEFPPSSPSNRSSHSFSHPLNSPATTTSYTSWIVPHLPIVLSSSSSPYSDHSDMEEGMAQSIVEGLANNHWSIGLGAAVLACENDDEVED